MSATAPSADLAVDLSPSREGAQLPGIDAHPHARAVLLPALPPAGDPSHAYLFHGPAGTGKRAIARAFAAVLLADGRASPGDGGGAGRARLPPGPDVGDPVGRGGDAGGGHRETGGGGGYAHSVRIGAARVRDRGGRRDERSGGQSHAQDARGATCVRAPAAADGSPGGRAADDRLALPAGSLRSASVSADSRWSRGRGGRAGASVCPPGAGRCGSGREAGERGGRGAAGECGGVRALGADGLDRRAAVDGAARRSQGGGGRRGRGAAGADGARAGARAEQGAQALRARGRWRHAAAASADRERVRSISRCAWRSCGCATCCACAKARPSSCTRWIGVASSSTMRGALSGGGCGMR